MVSEDLLLEVQKDPLACSATANESTPRLSVIMPAYNEEGAIESAVNEVQQFVLSVVPESELIVINDGSRDQTGAILDQIAQADERVVAVHQKNGGHGKALRTGLEKARGDYVLLI